LAEISIHIKLCNHSDVAHAKILNTSLLMSKKRVHNSYGDSIAKKINISTQMHEYIMVLNINAHNSLYII